MSLALFVELVRQLCDVGLPVDTDVLSAAECEEAIAKLLERRLS